MQKLFFSLLFIFLFTISVSSQEKPITAVFPFNAVGVAEVESIIASNLFETALVQTNSFMIIEQNQITDILETLGRNIDAYKVTFASIDDLSDSVELLAYKMAGLNSNPTAKIGELQKELAVLKLAYEKEEKRVSKGNIFKYLLGGLAITSLGSSGISWVLGDTAYTNYTNTVYTDKAAEYRAESEMYDVIKYSAGAVGIGFSVLTFIDWTKVDKRSELK